MGQYVEREEGLLLLCGASQLAWLLVLEEKKKLTMFALRGKVFFGWELANTNKYNLLHVSYNKFMKGKIKPQKSFSL